MYYILSWNDNNDEYSIIGNYESVWMVYWTIKESLKNQYPTRDQWIKCVDKEGKFIDLTKGLKCEYFPEGYNGKILLKPASSILD